jgi:putative hydrolase
MYSKIETHFHTVASGHGYSTILEGIAYAKKYQMAGLAITDHGPQMPGGPHIWHFGNLSCIGREVDGIKIIKGAEANILNYDGELDFPEEFIHKLDWVIASYHVPCCKPATVEEHTRGYLNVLQNPYVDVLGHSGNNDYVYDYERVILEAKRLNKVIEINNHSSKGRLGSSERCPVIAALCKKHGVNIVVGTDAHFAPQIGVVDTAMKMLQDIEFPQELILNMDEARFFNYLNQRKNHHSY